MCNCFNDVWSSFFRKSIKNRQIVWSSWSAIQSPEIGFVLGHSKSFWHINSTLFNFETEEVLKNRKHNERSHEFFETLSIEGGPNHFDRSVFLQLVFHISYFLQLDRRTWRLPFWSCDQLPLCGELCHLQLISCDSLPTLSGLAELQNS